MSYSGGAAQTSRSKWSTRFPVYQIDFTAVASGKRVATSKRRVRWRFGFSNKEALEAGETGTACRGEEHDVTVVWSVTSGKRLILADGQEVHYSTVRSGIFEFSWTMRGNHVLKVVAHAAPQLNPTPGFRQYDLNVDGQSFFVMPKVYELGIRGPISSHAVTPGVTGAAAGVVGNNATSQMMTSANPHQPPVPGRSAATHGYYDLNKGEYVQARDKLQEETDLQKAIAESIQESRKHLQKREGGGVHDNGGGEMPNQVVDHRAAATATGEMDLLNMMGSMAVAPTSQSSINTTATTPTQNTGYNAFGGAQANPYAQQQQQQQPPQNNNTQLVQQNFSSAPAAAYASAPPPALMNAPAAAFNAAPASYAPAPAAYNQPAYATTSPNANAAYGGNPQQHQQYPVANQYPSNTPSTPVTNVPPPVAPEPVLTTTAPPEAPAPVPPQPDAPSPNVSAPTPPVVVGADSIMNKLVNFDNISAPAQSKKNDGQFSNIFSDQPSSGGGNAANHNSGPQPSLSEMKSSKPTTAKQDIMNTQYSNALVATGTQPGYGVQLPQAYTQNQQQQQQPPGYGYGYGQQQQPQPPQQQQQQQQYGGYQQQQQMNPQQQQQYYRQYSQQQQQQQQYGGYQQQQQPPSY